MGEGSLDASYRDPGASGRRVESMDRASVAESEDSSQDSRRVALLVFQESGRSLMDGDLLRGSRIRGGDGI